MESSRRGFLRCAPAAERRGDAVFGTAAPAERFLLVEQPGAWGRSALSQSRLDPGVGQALLERVSAVGARLLLIRRVLRDPGAPRRWAVADARAGREQVWWGEFGDERELLEVLLEQPAGRPSNEPVLLVCTHGRHDACCAQRGWPVAVALAGAYPGQTWQCSHVGGDRFAANIVILPHGLYYGRLAPPSALGAVGEYALGRVASDFLRGRSIFSAPIQVAQHHARLALREDRIDTLHPASLARLDSGVLRIVLARDSGEVVVRLRPRMSEPIPRITCRSTEPRSVVEYELLALDGGSDL